MIEAVKVFVENVPRVGVEHYPVSMSRVFHYYLVNFFRRGFYRTQCYPCPKAHIKHFTRCFKGAVIYHDAVVIRRELLDDRKNLGRHLNLIFPWRVDTENLSPPGHMAGHGKSTRINVKKIIQLFKGTLPPSDPSRFLKL